MLRVSDNQFSDLRSYSNYDLAGQVITIKYRCAHCEKSHCFFILKIDKSKTDNI